MLFLTIYTNILFIVSIDLIIDTANITWINIVIQLGSTFGLYIIFLIAVHFMPLFNSYASIYNSVNSPLLWLNLFFVFSACLLFDYASKTILYIFKPNYARELQIIYSRYGRINSTKRLSRAIKKKLPHYNKNSVNESLKEESPKQGREKERDRGRERTRKKERDSKREREDELDERYNRQKRYKIPKNIEIKSVSQSKEYSKSKSNIDSLGS